MSGIEGEQAAERWSRASLEDEIQRKFRYTTTEALIARMERAEDFGYDDESVELNRRLGQKAMTWRWDGNKVVVYGVEGEL